MSVGIALIVGLCVGDGFKGALDLEPAQRSRLGTLLANASDSDKRDSAGKIEAMRWTFVVCLAVLLLIGVLCWMFLHYEKGDLLREIIALLIGLGGGGAGGFGLGRWSARSS